MGNATVVVDVVMVVMWEEWEALACATSCERWGGTVNVPRWIGRASECAKRRVQDERLGDKLLAATGSGSGMILVHHLQATCYHISSHGC